MTTCHICKQEILPGEGFFAMNMVTGYQADLHQGQCWEKYKSLGAWCRMGKHDRCISYPDLPCACECHKREGA